ncbi:MAG TPA: NAD(P)-dependent oxidoreductase [Myxococcota bacterium]|nr:NAD(P)-dependent oxidoreductase [Myxococcota bacterium]
MSPAVLLGLDAGGGGARCLLLDAQNGAVTTAIRPWKHSVTPETGGLGRDLDLAALWASLADATHEALARAGLKSRDVVGVATTSMRFSTVVLGPGAQLLLATPNRDARASLEGLRLAADHGPELHRRSGHWPSPICTAARLRWLATREAGAQLRAPGAAVLALSDWLTWRLCGEITAERSHAGSTLLFDFEADDWAWDLIDRFQLPRAAFPRLVASGTRVGALAAEAAAALGVPAGIPVGVGGADTPCGLLGAGVVDPGETAVVAGTTAPVQQVTERPVLDPDCRLWIGTHVVPGRYVLESNAGSMGETLEFIGRVLYPDAPNPAARVLADAAASEPGAAGMLSTFGAQVMDGRDLKLPMGSLTFSHLCAPDDPDARRHVSRALVEGMAFALRANLEQITATSGKSHTRLRIAGGMSRSPAFAQLLCEVLGREVELCTHPETTALGAALCAGVAAGAFSDVAEAGRSRRPYAQTLTPASELERAYAPLYQSWHALRKAQDPALSAAQSTILPAVIAAGARAGSSAPVLARPRIFVTADLDEESLGKLRAIGEVVHESFRERMRLLTGLALVQALAGFEVFVTEVDVVDVAALEKLPDLRVIAACRGDAVNVDVAACSALGIPVIHAPGRNAGAVADLTLAFLLMLARKLPAAEGFLRNPEIQAGDLGRMGQAFQTFRGRELWRKTVGLVGFGSVGREVAKRLCAFGARVLVYDPYLAPDQVIRAGAEAVALDDLLAASDFVSLHASVSDHSRGLLGARELARMKRGAFLVNTARAALVDETALAEQLRAGHLAGAALDAFSVEPPGADHPLLALPNVIATPHIGGNTLEVATHQGRIIAADLARIVHGERPQHVLDPDALREFALDRPRRLPAPGTLAALAARRGPAVSDLQRDAIPSARAPVASAAAAPATGETVEKFTRILQAFSEQIGQDGRLRAFSADQDVTLHFLISDFGRELFFRLRRGAVSSGLGAPDGRPEVQLRLKADVLDGMFTGRVNPMEKAMSGELSFTGDAAKAMTLQHLQADLRRLYRAAREAVGDPGDLAAVGRAAVPAAEKAVCPADKEREELVAIVRELYAQELITATGGNVSVRIPGTDELWITPSQLFKGDLRPEILVRIDLEGQPLGAGGFSPSSERLMHCAVYQARNDARAVVHAHAPHATILANAGLPFLPISTEAAFFGEIPRVPFIMPGTSALADAVREAVRKSWAVLLVNHGLLVAGRSLRRAADMVEIVERSAEVILGCHALGRTPPTLPEDAVRALRQMGDLVA